MPPRTPTTARPGEGRGPAITVSTRAFMTLTSTSHAIRSDAAQPATAPPITQIATTA
jgi:hypothetical protein